MKQLNWIDAGSDYIAVDDRGHVLGLIRVIGGLSDTQRVKPLESNDRPLKPPNPKVEQRIRDRLKRRVERRREVRLIENER